MDVSSVADARIGLSRALAAFRDDPDADPVVIGAHRRPEAVLLSYERFLHLDPQSRSIDLAELRRYGSVLERLAHVAHLREVRVFGSVARGEQRAGSDVDLLVTPDADATLFDIAQFELDAETVLGVPVTALPSTSVDATRDARILAEAVPL
ncbi:nucleotidyltransferase domain-containing protein [Microbacterium sp. MMO-10]